MPATLPCPRALLLTASMHGLLFGCDAERTTTGRNGTGRDPSSDFDAPYDSGAGDMTTGGGNSESDAAAASNGADGGAFEVACRSARAKQETLTSSLHDALGSVSVSVTGTACARSYSLTSTAPQRDPKAPATRTVLEHPDTSSLSTNHPLFDALYALALEEARENSVDRIQDGSFGAALDCPPGGCFQTGELWTYVWTRDTAYSLDLALAALDPIRAQNSLLFKLSELRTGGGEQIVQDTGSGGSYPISSDRVVWALGARRLLPYLPDGEAEAFSGRAYIALKNTLEHDRKVVYDAKVGLYRGEQSFLDWREQSYPSWVANDVVHLGMSYALSTNVLHLAAMSWARELAESKSDLASAERYGSWAKALRSKIAERFWLEDRKQFSSFLTTSLDPAPVQRFDALGTALAVLWEVGSRSQREAAVAGYPLLPQGAPVIWPQQQDTPIYHNRAIWPFVSAYLAQAGRAVENDALVAHTLRSLVRGAALNLSNMENLELVSGAAQFDDPPNSGPVVNSRRQLWSVAGYLSMVHHVLFGIEVSSAGLSIRPFLPSSIRSDWLGDSKTLVLNRFPFRDKTLSVELQLPEVSRGSGAYRVGAMRLNGRPVSTAVIPFSALSKENLIEVELLADTSPTQSVSLVSDVSDYRRLFGPRAPIITDTKQSGAGVELSLTLHSEIATNVRMSIYRDGQRIASDLPGTTTRYVDSGISATGPSPCYSAELCYNVSGNCSQHAAPRCHWGESYERIVTRGASELSVTGGTRSQSNGRDHIGDWGGPDDKLSATFAPDRTGLHRVQLTFANGAGPINTGITCAVKRVEVIEGRSVIASGYVLMPHTGSASTWRGSSFLEAQLDAGKTYQVVVSGDAHSGNMSRFKHFERYTGTGGTSGNYERVEIAELKLLGP